MYVYSNDKYIHTYVCMCVCRTVEVNNTDAEGRLVLGDGVSRWPVRECVIIQLYFEFAHHLKTSTVHTYIVHAL